MPFVLRTDDVQCLVVRKPHGAELGVQERCLFRGRVDTDFSGFQHGMASHKAVRLYIIDDVRRRSIPQQR